jgi:hypothetical protein
LTETEKLYRASIARDKAAKREADAPRLAEMRKQRAAQRAEIETVRQAVKRRKRSY